MATPFFPDPVFGWVFYLALVSIAAIAAYVDLRTLIVPKWLSLPTLALGILFNLCRGAWLGYEGYPTWILGEGNLWLGMLDGLLFSLAGFFAAFAFFLVLFILGTCKGGDVKLCAAVGAWIGAWFMFMVVIGTLAAVVVLSVGLLIVSVFSQGWTKTQKDYTLRKGKHGANKTRVPRRRLMSFSLPVALAIAVVLLWVFRTELLDLPSKAGEPESAAHVHARQVSS